LLTLDYEASSNLWADVEHIFEREGAEWVASMKNFEPGTLHDGICFDHAVSMYGDGEHRVSENPI
jgi:hypothetical protein